MNSLDLISMGLRNLYRRKARTLLTVLGVVIGTAAIVVMLSLGIGMNERSEKQIRSMGSLNTIEVNNYGVYDESGRSSQSSVLDDKAVSQFSSMEGVEAATPLLEAYPKLVSGKYVAYAQIVGIDTKAMAALDYKVSEGRLLQEGEANTIVVGVNVAQNFYNPKSRGNSGWYMGGSDGEPLVDIMNDKIELTFDTSYGEKKVSGDTDGNSSNKPAKLYKIKVAGLLAQSDDEKDYTIYMDINQLKKLMKEYERSQSSQDRRRNTQQQESYNRVLVKVKEINDVDGVQEKIKQMGFGTFSLSDIRKSMQEQARTIQMVLGGIGAISLLIAALGITNTMIMSIYERTREIGVMKVLGCMLGDIRRLFLFEAGMIGLMGGIAGIAFSFGASVLLNYVGGSFMEAGGIYMGGDPSEKISVIPLWLVLASVGFAVLIGLISGFYPARRAMRLSALEAIKTE